MNNRYREISGVVLILIAALFAISVYSYTVSDINSVFTNSGVVNTIGPIGSLISHIARSAFGLSSYIIAVIFAVSGFLIIRQQERHYIFEKIFCLLFAAIALSSLLSVVRSEIPQNSGGYLGLYIHKFLALTTGKTGSFLIIAIMNITSLILLGLVSITGIYQKTTRYVRPVVRIKSLFEKFRLSNRIEHIIIDEPKSDDKKMPWITKKKILTYEIDSDQNPYFDPRKYLETSLGLTHTSNEKCETLPAKQQELKKQISSEMIPEAIDYKFESLYNNSLENAEDEENYDFTINEEEIKPLKLQTKDISLQHDEEKKIDPVPTVQNIKSRNEPIKRAEGKVFDEIVIKNDYTVPTSYLHSSSQLDSDTWKNEVKRNSQLLVNTLADFGIDSRVVNVNRGPVLTLYEVQIAPGIKVTRIVGLADDIAMALAASRVRVVAPIPGKSAIGVEIPNKDREGVTLGDIIKSEDYQTKEGSLKVAVGKDILGKPVVIDLKRLPHLLIAGATGSGKSVCVNSIITSLIYNYEPNHVRFIMVDPKMVELQIYNGLAHLLTPVITEPHAAPFVLKWALFEMDRRYRLLSQYVTRDIEKYNEKVHTAGLNEERLPYIVVIIDELADLMMVASKDIEGYITRIAQKARAVGIHLVLATQRPSVDIITGVIKANFPARIAFQVAQKTDSRTIIDQNGAEKLLGKGDMLYQSPLTSFPTRIQGAYISEDEICKIVEHLKKLYKPHYIDIEQSVSETEEEMTVDENDDELFVEALKIVEDTRKASASYLQRRLSIGYNRAARIIEQMEERGYIGPQLGSKPREILI